MTSERYRKGAEAFEQVIGYPPPEGRSEFLRLTVENLFGDVWASDGMSVRDRRLVTITLLTLSLKEDSLAGHIEQAMRSGDFSRKDLEALMIHLAHYAGWPTGQLGYEVLMKVAGKLRAEKPGP